MVTFYTSHSLMRSNCQHLLLCHALLRDWSKASSALWSPACQIDWRLKSPSIPVRTQLRLSSTLRWTMSRMHRAQFLQACSPISRQLTVVTTTSWYSLVSARQSPTHSLHQPLVAWYKEALTLALLLITQSHTPLWMRWLIQVHSW